MNPPPHGGFTLRAALCAVCLGPRHGPRLVVVLPDLMRGDFSLAISAALRFAGGGGVEAKIELVFPAELTTSPPHGEAALRAGLRPVYLAARRTARYEAEEVTHAGW